MRCLGMHAVPHYGHGTLPAGSGRLVYIGDNKKLFLESAEPRRAV